MNRTSRLLLTGLFVLVAGAAFAVEPDIQALINAAPSADDHPTADQITLYERIEITVDADGRATHRVHQVRRILTNWAMRRVTDPRVGWDSSRQELVVDVCRTYQAGGAVIDSPDNALNEVTPDAVGRCAEFLDLREMVISHVGLEPGCVIELDYTVRDLEPGLLPPSGQIFLQDRWPVLERSVALSGPDLRWEFLQGEAEVAEEARGVTVTVRDVPGLPDEGNGAHRGDYAASVVYSFGNDDGWAGLGRTLGTVGEKTVVLDDAMNEWVAQDENGEPDLTKLDTVQRIAALIGDRTRTVHLPGGLTSRAPRPAPGIFDAGCASRWEEALLGAALLEAVDLEPAIYLVGRYETTPKDVACAAFFGEALIAVELDGEEWWLSPERGKAWTGHCGRPNRTLLRGYGSGRQDTADYRRVVGPRDGRCVLNVDLRPGDEDGIDAVIDWNADGLLRGDGMDADKLAEQLAGALPDAEITGTEVLTLEADRAHLRVTAHAEALGAFTDGVLAFALPKAPHTVFDSLPRTCRLQERTRHTPVFLPGAMVQELNLRIELPEGIAADALPAGAVVQDGVVVIRTRLALSGDRVDPADWPALRARLAETRNAGPIVLIRE